MANFKTRIKNIAKERGKLILANDYKYSAVNIEKKKLFKILKH